MFRRQVLIAGTSLALVAALMGSATAGENNEVLVLQESPAGTTNGNQLSIDQSGASNSLVTGIDASSVGFLPALALQALNYNPLFATQRGEGNTAALTLTGNGGELQLLQSSNPLAPFIVGNSTGNNRATVTAGTNDLGAVIQIGSGNAAGLDLNGGSQGLVTQLGSNLTADLNVGAGGNGQIVQIGNNSNTGTVLVPANTTVTVTQIGNNVQPVGPTAVQVISATNPGSISITQTAW